MDIASISTRQRLVRVAQGHEAADVVVQGALVADVFGLTLQRQDVAIADGFVACLGQNLQGKKTIHANGVLAPGFLDGHVHLESAMLSAPRFAELVVPRGTVGVVAEPHELVNVAGLVGLTWTLAAGERAAMHVWASAPSCVPASPFENAGASINAQDVHTALQHPNVLGLAEMMNFPGILNNDPNVWAILEAARGVRRDGHAAGLRGAAWQAYAAAGLESDHETTTEDEALERIQSGTWLMVREGSAARNLAALAPLLARLRPHRAMFVSDDVDAKELLELGHMDRILREAVRLGLDPIYALRLASVSVAEYWRLPWRGAIAPGHVADLVLLHDVVDFKTQWTMIAGRIVAQNGALLENPQPAPKEPALTSSVRLPQGWNATQLRLPPSQTQHVIGVHPDQIYTEHLHPSTPTQNGHATTDPTRDLVKLAVIERHSGHGNTGVCLAQGIGLQRGAIAQTVLHDSHNIIVAGVDDNDMACAVHALAQLGGGVVVVENGQILAQLELPIAGLVSDADPNTVVAAQRAIEDAARRLGCTLPHPIMTLAFLGLTVIPKLKLTDEGLFDVVAFKRITEVD